MTFGRVAIPALTVILLVANLSFAAPAQLQDTSRRLYDRVMEEYKHRDYEAALAGFRLFVELHGHSLLAANAHYWIGECQYRLGRYKDALTTFYNLISYYPLSSKMPASTLKIGQSYGKLGDRDKARMMYQRVIEQYPDSVEASVARRAVEVPSVKTETSLRPIEESAEELPR